MNKTDEVVEDIISKRERRAVAFYLLASYLYYVKGVSMMSDEVFDKLCLHLLREVNTGGSATKHQHSKYLDRASLEAGTGYAIKKYPNMVIGAANHYEENKL